MSDSKLKLYQRAMYLRNLLVAHLTGRNVNESDYFKLRQYFMGLSETSDIVPDMVAEFADLSSLWHSMRYSHASHEDRQSYVVEQFSGFLEALAPDDQGQTSHKSSKSMEVDEERLHGVWNESAALLTTQPDVAISRMEHLVETLCYFLLRHLKVVPDPLQHNLPALVELTERSLQLAPGKQYHLVVKELISGCAETLQAIENFKVDQAHLKNNQPSKNEKIAAAKILISLYGSLASMLLAGWRVRQMLQSGSSQR